MPHIMDSEESVQISTVQKEKLTQNSITNLKHVSEPEYQVQNVDEGIKAVLAAVLLRAQPAHAVQQNSSGIGMRKRAELLLYLLYRSWPTHSSKRLTGFEAVPICMTSICSKRSGNFSRQA